MGDTLRVFQSSKSFEPMALTGKTPSQSRIVVSNPGNICQKASKCIVSMKQGVFRSGATADIVHFLLTTAALEIVRRLSRAKCPFVWRGVQMLQVFCYPPFKWLQRWSPFKGLVEHIQKLSKPLLVLTVAKVASDELASIKEVSRSFNSSFSEPETQSDPSSQLSIDRRSCDYIPKSLPGENWMVKLCEELRKQDISLPDRLNEDELRKFYAAVDGDFPRLLTSIKKTIRWRQTYTLFSPQELQAWSELVFWHGCDVKQQPCLIIRLGLVCTNLEFNDRPLFIKAIVSQIENGVLNLVDARRPQITVLMDCQGFSQFGFPLRMMRSCAMLLQDHYPNTLAFLIVIRLAPIARVIIHALFQVLKPSTRKKLRILGENDHETLSEYIQTLPSFLGGKCSCAKCSGVVDEQDANEEITQTRPTTDLTSNKNDPPSNFVDVPMKRGEEQVTRTAIIGTIVVWIFIAFILAMHYPALGEHLYSIMSRFSSLIHNRR